MRRSLEVITQEDLDRFIFFPENGVYLKSENERSVELWAGLELLATFYADRPTDVYVKAKGQNLTGQDGPEGSKMEAIYIGDPKRPRLKLNGERLGPKEYSLSLEAFRDDKLVLYANTSQGKVTNCYIQASSTTYLLQFHTGEGHERRRLGLPIDSGDFGWWRSAPLEVAPETENPQPLFV